MIPTTYVYFVYERRYGHFHVEVTRKMTKNCKDFWKKYKIECQRSYVHSWNFHILLIL